MEAARHDPVAAAGADADPPLRLLLTGIREGALTIGVVTAVTLLAAGAYLLVASSVYRASADLLVTPVPRDDSLATGLGLIKESSDPTRDISTAALLVTTSTVAERVRQELRLTRSASSLLGNVTAEPVADSNVVTVTAEAGTAREARSLADAFSETAVDLRSERMRKEIGEILPALRQRARREPVAGPDSPAGQVTRFETLLDGGDPTIRVETRAQEPSGPAEPKPALTMAAALIAGLVLGVGGAFARQALGPREARGRSGSERVRGSYTSA